MNKTSFPKNQIKVLLLENIHPFALEAFKGEGFQVESLPEALTADQLKKKIQDIHVLGIRSKTQVSEEILKEAKRLLTLGCFLYWNQSSRPPRNQTSRNSCFQCSLWKYSERS